MMKPYFTILRWRSTASSSEDWECDSRVLVLTQNIILTLDHGYLRSTIVTSIADDDVLYPRYWLRRLEQAFQEHPDLLAPTVPALLR